MPKSVPSGRTSVGHPSLQLLEEVLDEDEARWLWSTVLCAGSQLFRSMGFVRDANHEREPSRLFSTT